MTNTMNIGGFEIRVRDREETRAAGIRTRSSNWTPMAVYFRDELEPGESIALTVAEEEVSTVRNGLKNAIAALGFITNKHYIGTSTQKNGDGTLELVVVKLQELRTYEDVAAAGEAVEEDDEDEG